jgi:hypothetical protein
VTKKGTDVIIQKMRIDCVGNQGLTIHHPDLKISHQQPHHQKGGGDTNIMSVSDNRGVTWVRKIAPLQCVIRTSNGDAPNKFCPYFTDQLFGAYLGNVLGPLRR